MAIQRSDAQKRYAQAWYLANQEEQRAHSLAYRAAHLEERQAYDRAYKAANPERIKAYKAAYRAAHKDEIDEYNRAYRIAHADEQRVYGLAYEAAHRDERRIKSQAYRLAHPEKARKSSAEYIRMHPEKNRAGVARRRARKKGAPINDLTAAQWQEIKAAYGHRCVYCGRKMQRLTQDHITPLSQGGSHTVSNIVPSCHSCNSKKRTGPPLIPVQPLLFTIAPARTIKS